MKILSFDIGTYSIKAVELDISFGRVELSDYLIEKILEPQQLPEVETPQTQTDSAQSNGQSQNVKKAPPRQILSVGQANAIKKILSEKTFQYDRLAITLPKAWSTSRVFYFPTKDKRKIQSSLLFELDEETPFPIEQTIYDFANLGAEGNQSKIFTSVALKADIMSLISELQLMGLDPDMITVDAWAVTHLLKKSLPQEYQDQPICYVNIGDKQTTIHLFDGNNPVLTHVDNAGGSDVTQAIAEGYRISFDQAETAKIDGAFLLTQTHLEEAGQNQITEEQKHFSSVIANALAPIVREIKQSLMAYKGMNRNTPRAIFISGGTTLIPNISLFLEEHLKLPVYQFNYMSRLVGQTLQLSESSEAVIATAIGTALAISKVDRNCTINFRKDIFTKKGGAVSFDLASFRGPLQLVAASLAFIYVNLFVQSLILSSRAEKQEAILDKSIKHVLGAVSPTVMNNYKSSPTVLKNAVNKELTKFKQVTPPPKKAQISALDVLNKVSQSMPKDMVLDVYFFQVKEGRLKISGLVDQVANSIKIAKGLEDSNLLTELTKDKVEEDPKLKKVRFEFSAKIAEATVNAATKTK